MKLAESQVALLKIIGGIALIVGSLVVLTLALEDPCVDRAIVEYRDTTGGYPPVGVRDLIKRRCHGQ